MTRKLLIGLQESQTGFELTLRNLQATASHAAAGVDDVDEGLADAGDIS